MKQRELDEHVRLHRLHLNNERGGKKLDLSGADLSNLNMRALPLCGAILNDTKLENTDLEGADLEGAQLKRANLSSAHLSGALLRHANLHSAIFLHANLGKSFVYGGANLYGANLHNANFFRADMRDTCLTKTNLYGCIGNMREVKSLQIDTWPVTYTAETLQIGCQGHPISLWREWRNNLGWVKHMHIEAEEWVERHLDHVLAIIDASPATTTGREDEGKWKCSMYL